MILLQVVEELFDIGTEAVDRSGGHDETVDSHATIVTGPQFPGSTSNGDRADRRPDRVDISISSQPVTSVSVGQPYCFVVTLRV